MICQMPFEQLRTCISFIHQTGISSQLMNDACTTIGNPLVAAVQIAVDAGNR